MARDSGVLLLAGLVGCQVLREEDPGVDGVPDFDASAEEGDEVGEEGEVSDTSGGELQPDGRALFIADPAPPPIVGGNLLVLDDDRVFVSDPDRGLVHVVDLAEMTERAVLELGEGTMPWRAVADANGHVHVVLRGSGELASIDPSAGVVAARRAVCSHPRGLAIAPEGDAVLVACAAGELMRVPIAAEGVAEKFAMLEPDLRDVLVVDGVVHVSRFRSAELLTLDAAGAIVDRVRAASWVEEVQGATMRASAAWRTIAVPGGGWLIAHQGGSDADLDPNEDTPITYGGPSPCTALVQSSATFIAPDGTATPMGSLDGIRLPVDVTLDPTGRYAAIVAAGTCPDGCPSPTIAKVDLQASIPGLNPPCTSPEPIYYSHDDVAAQIIAVAYARDGSVLAQRRDPAALLVVVDELSTNEVPLQGASLEDTGHRLFHEVGAAGLTCASCHPEGGDDGLVWNLDGPRHTPALDVGLGGTAPFHWGGELDDFAMLVSEVHEGRMGEMIQSPVRVDAFEAWVTGLGEAPIRAMDEPATAGRELFLQYRCDSCHAGTATTNNLTVVAGWGDALQVPSLHSIGLHPPYMHDGRAPTLAAAVRDMLARTLPDEHVDDAQVEQLVAYLQTL